MNRLAFKLLVFLLLGAIVNVAVAWALVWQEPPKRQTGFYLSPHLPPWWYSLWEQPGRVFLIGEKNTHADTAHEYDPDRYPHWSRLGDSFFEHQDRVWLEQATGWPMLSVESMIGFQKLSWQPEIVRTGLLVESHAVPVRNRLLGYCPIWPRLRDQHDFLWCAVGGALDDVSADGFHQAQTAHQAR